MADPIPAPPLPSHLQPITPTFARRGEFMPQEGGRLMVTLPGEIVESKVVEVLDKDVVVVKVVGMVIDKAAHGIKKDSIIVVKRIDNGLQEVWEHITDREIRERQAVEDAREAVRAKHAREAEEALAAADAPATEAAAPVPRGTRPAAKKTVKRALAAKRAAAHKRRAAK